MSLKRNKLVKKTAQLYLILTLAMSNFMSIPATAQENEIIPQLTTSSTITYNEDERKIKITDDWKFQLETSGSIPGVQLPSFNDSQWRQLDLPHDWSIELDFNYQSPATHEAGYLDGGVGWYRKTFTLPSDMDGKSISIDFDGVYMDSTTYLNGRLIGNYPYGYNAFSYDITDDLYTDGRDNVLVVKVNNRQPSSRWYSGSGIYRNVYLTVTDPVHVAKYGTFVTTPDLETAYAEGRADVNIKTEVVNDSNQAAQVQVRSTIVDAEQVSVSTVTSSVTTIAAGATYEFEDNTSINQPTLWDVDNPYRYTLISEVISNGNVVDTYETKFGARYFEFNNNDGFSLNGRYMKLHGVSMHHDQGALGAASYYRAVERQMQIMKDMGVNAIRVTHNPASPELIEICNELGLLVVDEAFDAWQVAKKQYDYARFFNVWSDQYNKTWAEHDVKEMVDRGKNEPSIIMWSLGNEIYDVYSQTGPINGKKLHDWVKEVDTTRPTTMGQDRVKGNLDQYQHAVLDTVDIVGLNYGEVNYVNYHNQNPDWIIYGSETSSATRSRGIYTHPYTYNSMATYSDYQQSSYDNDRVGWGLSAEDAWKADRNLKHIAGQFIWTGFDYIGEPTPYYASLPKSSYFGAVDTAGFPKDIFYYYQSQWKSESMVHLLPHWNWSEGETVRVLAYTNAHTVELKLNGTTIGERSYQNKTTSDGRPYKETAAGKTYLEWAVPFEAGTLEAIAKNEQGEVIAYDKVVTAGEPAAVRLTADRSVITADGYDLSYVTVDIVDENGVIVPNADHLVKFNIAGEGILAGVDNGNALSIERFKANERKAFSGKALAILESTKTEGIIQLTATSAGLASDSIQVFTVDSSDQDEREVAGFEWVNVKTKVNEAPVLPSQVDVYYKNSDVETKSVVWNSINPSQYAQLGTFSVEGEVDGILQKVIANVIVTDIVAVKNAAVVTATGNLPILPSKVTVLYSDDSTSEVPVVWEQVTQQQVERSGQFNIEGTVTLTNIKAKLQVRVTDDYETKNIMLPVTGTNYPQLSASFTAGGDYLAHINDGIISYNSNPKNRWTNWQSSNPGDSITVTFDRQYLLDNTTLYVFTDHGTAVPSNVTVEYWNGSTWVQVANKIQPSPYITGENVITFDPVQTDRMRYYLTSSESGKWSALTEIEVFADVLSQGDTAQLQQISVDGLPLEDFDPRVYHYELTLPAESEIPVISATASNNAVFTILPAYNIPGVSKIYVVSENGMNKSEYTISWQYESAPKQIEKLDATNVIVEKTVEPTLPSKILAHYNDETSELVNVSWSAINPSQYAREGTFTVTGTVDGTTILAQAVIQVKTVIAVESYSTAILDNQTPNLPTSLTVYYSDGTEAEKAVTWTNLARNTIANVANVGADTYQMTGQLVDTVAQATAGIRVTDDIDSTKNIAYAKNGYDYPKAEASFYNNGPSSLDTIEALNDGIISFTDSPQNRWTNWQRTPRTGDWVSITFGDYGPVEQDVDNINIYWFQDSGTSYPASFKIQYKSGDQWIDVTNVTSNPANPAANQLNEYTFDMVRTSSIRVDMVAQSGKSLAIAELEVFAKYPVLYTDPEVSDISVNGNSILDQFERVNGVYEANVTLAPNSAFPEITAQGNNNTRLTIIPATAANPVARIIAVSEDGTKQNVYRIHFDFNGEEQPTELQVDLVGPSQVNSEQQFTVELGLKGVESPVQAQDIIIAYDTNKFEFMSAQSKLASLRIVEEVTSEPGQIRLLLASIGQHNAIQEDVSMIDLTFKAKITTETVLGSVDTIQATVSDSHGEESNALLKSLWITILPLFVPGNPDVNNDGRYSIGDLSMAAASYGKNYLSPDWNFVKRADINGDGKIDIDDLAEIANIIVNE